LMATGRKSPRSATLRSARVLARNMTRVANEQFSQPVGQRTTSSDEILLVLDGP
jgi:hypothetical protein